MMTDVVVAPSLEGLLVGCVLLNGTVPVGVTVPTVCVGEVVSTVVGGVVVGGGVVFSGFDAVERKHITWYHGTIDKNVTFVIVHNTISDYPQ